ncbi:MAG: sugar kinase [Pseudomonadota bacterium]
MIDLLCLGEPMVEFVRQKDGSYLQGYGGDTSNAAIAAARQGAKVGYLTTLGKDRFGDAMTELWDKEGIDTSGVGRNPDAPTGIYFVDPDPEGRYFTYYRNGSAASLMVPEGLDLSAITSAKCLHVSGITLAVSESMRATALAAMDAMRDAGQEVSLDTNLRLKLWDIDTARDVTIAAMVSASIAVTSMDDAEHLTGLTKAEEVAEFYRQIGPETVLVTMGADGCLLRHNEDVTHIPPAAANPVDSTGAGDSFAGAFLAWGLELGNPVEAAKRAAIVAAGTVSGMGAVAPIPRREDVLAVLTE